MLNHLRGIVFTGLFLVAMSAKGQNLHEAVSQGDTVKALQFIRSGANVNELDANGSSPLMTACRWGNIAMVRLLLNNGAKADEPRSVKGRTPLMISCAYYGGITITKLLVDKGANINAAAKDGTTALMLAAGNVKLDVVEYLLSKGANATAKDSNGLIALDHAGKAEVSSYLKESVKDCRIDKEAVIARLSALKH